jgi:hypothetical protein
MSPAEYDYEPIPGLPGHLPAGELLLWQGSPDWWMLTRRALHVVPIALYFLLLAGWQATAAFTRQHSWLAIAHAVRIPLLLGTAVILILLAVGWASARATVYSITSRRVVMRHGIALPMSLNLPFRRIDSAALLRRRDGSGDLTLRLRKTQRIGYLLNWPHVRAGHYLHPQACLRALPDAPRAAQLLAAALHASVREVEVAQAIAPLAVTNVVPAAAAPARASVAA